MACTIACLTSVILVGYSFTFNPINATSPFQGWIHEVAYCGLEVIRLKSCDSIVAIWVRSRGEISVSRDIVGFVVNNDVLRVSRIPQWLIS